MMAEMGICGLQAWLLCLNGKNNLTQIFAEVTIYSSRELNATSLFTLVVQPLDAGGTSL